MRKILYACLKKSNEMQQYADIYLLLNYSTCFGRPWRPSSGVHKTVVVGSGTENTIWGTSFFKRDHIRAHKVRHLLAHSKCSLKRFSLSFSFLMWRNLISWFIRHLVAVLRVLWHCWLLPLIQMLMYTGVSLLSLHVLLYHMAAFFLYIFFLVLLNWQITYVCFGVDKFYIHGSVHRNIRLKKSNKMQQYGGIYLLLNYCTCFGRPSRPSSGVHKTVVKVSGTDHTILVWLRLRKLAPPIVWSVPEAATTVLCTPDDRRDGRPKHVD